MLRLSEKECIALINKGECFHAEVESGSFTVKIDEYSPFVCTAIHNGHNLRDDLQSICALTTEERLYAEAPYTADMLSSFPIVLIGNDSRFEYDLNRPKAHSTNYKTAWKKPLTTKQRNESHAKHQSFYNVLSALVTRLEKQFKNSIVFDVHSYNYQKIEGDTPTFNIGTSQIDIERWGTTCQSFEKQLSKIELPNLDVRAARDEVFQGRGYLIAHVNAHFDHTLVLPLEVKKVFMDETTGELYPLVLEELKAGVKQAMSETAAYFMRRFGKRKSVRNVDLLSSTLPPEILSLDKSLFKLASNVATLKYINPINIASERKKFLARKGAVAPEFSYKQLNLNPYQFREQLYKLPVSNIMDADIQQLYRHVIDNLATKIDLLCSIGSDEFVYNSLKYYGQPDKDDIANAEFLLRAPNIEGDDEEAIYDSAYAVKSFQKQADEWGLKCKVEKSTRIVAKAMVNNERGSLLINKDAMFTSKELVAFAYHELGVHMLTTMNARRQKLRVLSLGLVGNTHTQEGVAIYSEYCSGNLTLNRLKILALRVIAVNLMLEQRDFSMTFETLKREYGQTTEQAFTLTTRVYRGGGLTKDFLYLKGFRDIVNLSKTTSLDNLLAGKAGTLDLPILNEMVERNMLERPVPLFELKHKSTPETAVIDYLISAIR
ncbi:flavohemoglobin expression-modulating QEGLA motif protein [uncultured Shewanella sp.]|uniref:flavohemoglobin expression-modulating QEGLA motif protein n=1 Tax=uncultured Shewanella sp. TaxID=173975 RepID=UPI002623CAE2|nr:flavohemoglobin expression-modulating QEGLA motif protein [uncultured Shewanella sp.]